ncbi:hypothetical protein SOV_50690 [Sporomusa ovata DSM 2662]|uniref:Uncharacterized protein n=1 Tax=Sporomusa ovata TaxID=2378 RepID=A0A0U1L0S9_9FIRM|nr:hypothetical protein [Sporomusa ovata]EQB27442.1 hypothetical protein SOV_2c03380 [Sporomusa ovata DSM 2662]CQR73288.1 hypothetical protein SpAn4DRAFT_2520 [Sporomusa ovata]
MFSLTKRQAAILLSVVLLCVAGWLLYQHFHQPQPITAESQLQAETAAGVDLAAKNAHIDMLQSQLTEAAQQIAELKSQPPNTIVKTVPVEVIKTIEVERQKSGADFAIVTDPTQPDKQVDSKEVEKLPTDTSVTLNQYNVFAYKKVIRGINVYPDWNKAVQGKFKLDEVTADVSRRISKDGKYIGVVAGYDFEHDKAKAGLRYSF